MQTFVPHDSFVDSIVCLDNKRLGKQRVEAFQILQTLAGHSKGWASHPAVKMWRGYEAALVAYYNCSLDEFSRRGFNNIKLHKLEPYDYGTELIYPHWWGDILVHNSHRGQLFIKDPEYYSQFKEFFCNDYYWPV